MNMTSIHSNTFSFQSQQLQYQNQNQKKIVDKHITPKEPAQIAESKSLEITAESLTIETNTTFDYDLENITPDETMELAGKLYKSGAISLRNWITLSVTGLNKKFPIENSFTDMPPDNQPFNLKKELQQIASGTSNHHFAYPAAAGKRADELLDFLLSLPEETTKIKYTSIDIQSQQLQYQNQPGFFTETYNNRPANLKEDLQQIVSGISNHNLTDSSIKTEASELLDLLLSLADKTPKSKYTSIDIKL